MVPQHDLGGVPTSARTSVTASAPDTAAPLRTNDDEPGMTRSSSQLQFLSVVALLTMAPSTGLGRSGA